MTERTIQRGGKTYVLVERREYKRLLAPRGVLPPLPVPDAAGNVNALNFARATIARRIINRRKAAGMTQTELATAAGIRLETLNRLEKARHMADVATLTKIEAALAGRKSVASSGRSRSGAKSKTKK
jgi:DNA-binding XRE family transcriptional regulator